MICLVHNFAPDTTELLLWHVQILDQIDYGYMIIIVIVWL